MPAKTPYLLPESFRFGVEIEFMDTPLKTFAPIFNQQKSKYRHGVKCSLDGWDDVDSKYKHWQLIADYSVTEMDDSGDDVGGEIVSPILDVCKESFLEIAKTIKLVNNNDGRFGSETGYHIHVDLGDLDRLVFLAIWYEMSSDIYGIFPDRANSHYSQSLIRVNPHGPDVPMINKVATLLLNNPGLIGEKYTDVHLYGEDDCRRAEIRCAQMVDDYDLIIGWTKMVLQIVNYAHQFHDIFELIDTRPSASIVYLNDHAPRVLKMTKNELHAIRTSDI